MNIIFMSLPGHVAYDTYLIICKYKIDVDNKKILIINKIIAQIHYQYDFDMPVINKYILLIFIH